MGIPDPGCCGGWFRAKIVPGKPSGAAFRVGPNNLALYRATPARPNADGRSFDPHGKMPVRAPVAQLDRVLVSEAKGHRFDSCRARHHAATSDPRRANLTKNFPSGSVRAPAAARRPDAHRRSHHGAGHIHPGAGADATLRTTHV